MIDVPGKPGPGRPVPPRLKGVRFGTHQWDDGDESRPAPLGRTELDGPTGVGDRVGQQPQTLAGTKSMRVGRRAAVIGDLDLQRCAVRPWTELDPHSLGVGVLLDVAQALTQQPEGQRPGSLGEVQVWTQHQVDDPAVGPVALGQFGRCHGQAFSDQPARREVTHDRAQGRLRVQGGRPQFPQHQGRGLVGRRPGIQDSESVAECGQILDHAIVEILRQQSALVPPRDDRAIQGLDPLPLRLVHTACERQRERNCRGEEEEERPEADAEQLREHRSTIGGDPVRRQVGLEGEAFTVDAELPDVHLQQVGLRIEDLRVLGAVPGQGGHRGQVGDGGHRCVGQGVRPHLCAGARRPTAPARRGPRARCG